MKGCNFYQLDNYTAFVIKSSQHLLSFKPSSAWPTLCHISLVSANNKSFWFKSHFLWSFPIFKIAFLNITVLKFKQPSQKSLHSINSSWRDSSCLTEFGTEMVHCHITTSPININKHHLLKWLLFLVRNPPRSFNFLDTRNILLVLQHRYLEVTSMLT